MQSKMLDSQARKTEQEIKQLKKKVTFVFVYLEYYIGN